MLPMKDVDAVEWTRDPWMHRFFDAIARDAGEPDYGPGTWFGWLVQGAPAEARPGWLEGPNPRDADDDVS
jgi:hypothetical protein